MGFLAHFLLQVFGAVVNVTGGIPSHVRTVVEEACEQAGVVLIGIQVRGSERQARMEITIDSESGVTHEHCQVVSRTLDERLEHDDFYGRLRAVEVSSPGADVPVAHWWQLKKSIGRTIECKLIDGTTITGKLSSVTEIHLEVIPKAAKKTQAALSIIVPNETIKQARVLLSFN